jgi:hypothetical protein
VKSPRSLPKSAQSASVGFDTRHGISKSRPYGLSLSPGWAVSLVVCWTRPRDRLRIVELIKTNQKKSPAVVLQASQESAITPPPSYRSW